VLGVPPQRSARAVGGQLLRIPLIGGGGRGAGTASQDLSTARATKLVALGRMSDKPPSTGPFSL